MSAVTAPGVPRPFRFRDQTVHAVAREVVGRRMTVLLGIKAPSEAGGYG